jgi:hypothetical protein
LLLAEAQSAGRAYTGEGRERAKSLLAMTHQAAAMILTKLGEIDLAWIAADRGLVAAQDSGNPIVIGSLFRSVTHSLLSTGHAFTVTARIRPRLTRLPPPATFTSTPVTKPQPGPPCHHRRRPATSHNIRNRRHPSTRIPRRRSPPYQPLAPYASWTNTSPPAPASGGQVGMRAAAQGGHRHSLTVVLPNIAR